MQKCGLSNYIWIMYISNPQGHDWDRTVVYAYITVHYGTMSKRSQNPDKNIKLPKVLFNYYLI